MKIRFGKDATGPYVEVTHTVRDQDDLVGADFYALDPEDRMKVCEHLPRAVNDRPAVRDHSEATATPPPGTVAALLAPALDLHAQIGDALDGEHRSNLIEALLYALGDARATLGAPTPLDLAVGEVCAVDVSGIVDAEPGTYFMTIADLANGEGQMSDRDRNMMIAAIAIRSVLACDASATKEPGQ